MRRVLVLLLPLTLAAGGARAQHAAVWDSVGRILQASPTLASGYVRYTFPRRDLTVRVGDVTLSPRLALLAWAGFSGPSPAATLMGQLVVTERELLPVQVAIDSQRLNVTAIHHHLLGEAPRLIYVHVHGVGPAVDLARRLDRVLARTATPRGVAAPATATVTIDTAAVFQALGARGSASGSVAQLGFVLVSTPVTLHRAALVPAMAYGSPVTLQAVTPDRFVATGDFAVAGERVAPLIGALAASGITATAVHNHLIGEAPSVYHVHFWADGAPDAVLAGLKAALDTGRGP
ncbi:MAG: DUF1259 domain-containing protein [Gemmatimonadales bacterium]